MRIKHACLLAATAFVGLVMVSPELSAQTFFQSAKAPTGEEEIAIAQFMENCLKAINSRSLDGWLACFAEDAKIDSKAARAVVNKESYKITLSRSIRSFISVETKATEIKVDSPMRATLTGMLEARGTGFSTGPDKHTWKLEKRDGKWSIVETRYE